MDEKEKNRVYIRKTKPSFTREQRAGFVLVIGSGIVALFLGFMYVGGHLADPLSVEYTGPIYLTQDQEELLEIYEQQQSDSDSDSLTDYDEIYVYRTSPYLLDTDGDSYNDNIEITAGTDPTCAAGTDCEAEIDTSTETDLNFTDLGDSENEEVAIEQIENAIKNLSVADIRQLLINSGVDEATVNGMSDEDVKAFFDAVISDLTSSGQLDTLIEGSLQ